MPKIKGSAKSGGRLPSAKTGEPKTQVQLRESDRDKLFAIAGGYTQGVEALLRLADAAIEAAHRGDAIAIDLLKEIDIEVVEEAIEPTIVRGKDGIVAAWIV